MVLTLLFLIVIIHFLLVFFSFLAQIFQPLLSTYLSRRELQHLREEVVKLHLETSEKEPSLPSAEVTQANPLTSNNEFAILPNELLMKIFSYLSPLDLCRCAQVCRHWSKASCDGMLWQELYPLRWIFRGDWRTGIDEYELHDGSNNGSCEEDKDKWECERYDIYGFILVTMIVCLR